MYQNDTWEMDVKLDFNGEGFETYYGSKMQFGKFHVDLIVFKAAK